MSSNDDDHSPGGEKTPLRVLMVEDQEDDALLLLHSLRRGNFDVSFERVDTLQALSDALKAQWDIVFSDYSMPTMNGMDVLSTLRQVDQDVPFMFVSGTIGEDLAVEAMRKGAQDYIMKDNIKRLLPAVRRELRDYQMRKGRRKAEARLHYLAHYDGLTGLANRFSFLEKLQEVIAEQRARRATVAVIYIDLDRFKTINDSLGYEAGNLLLIEVAKRLRKFVADKEMLCRLAADEFALIYCAECGGAGVADFVDGVFASLEAPHAIYDCSLYLSSSIGVAVCHDYAVDASDLLGQADIATHRVKDDGGKGVQFFTANMAVQLDERLGLERTMRTGFEKGEFYLHYQPQWALASGKVTGVEALLRWDSAQRGLVRPDTFVPLAEETGFILPLSEWVLFEACRQLKRWHLAGFNDLRVAVNISARQFHAANLLELVNRVLHECELPARYLELEITESSIIRDIDSAVGTLKKVQALGIKVALDDFGTGYSSLSYLKSFKTDYLKIDKSFISELTEDKGSQAIVNAIIAMAKMLSIQTIAEGVETEEQFAMLQEAGCDLIQGYYIARPMNAELLRNFVKNHGEFH